MKSISWGILLILAVFHAPDNGTEALECYECIMPNSPNKDPLSSVYPSCKMKGKQIKELEFDTENTANKKETFLYGRCLTACVKFKGKNYLIRQGANEVKICKEQIASDVSYKFGLGDVFDPVKEEHLEFCDECNTELCNRSPTKACQLDLSSLIPTTTTTTSTPKPKSDLENQFDQAGKDAKDIEKALFGFAENVQPSKIIFLKNVPVLLMMIIILV